MSAEVASSQIPSINAGELHFARSVIRSEGEALLRLGIQLDIRLSQAAELLESCQGSVIVCGMGKAGLVGQKIAATLASTGTRSHFLHPAEAVHGDLGRIGPQDLVLMLSWSGETEEVLRLLPAIESLQVPLVALTSSAASTLGRSATVVLELGTIAEACHLGLAPTTSTTAMMALGDALALVVSRRRGFSHADFARYHPAGSLGRRLAQVDDIMRPLADCRLAEQSETVRSVLVRISRPGRRSGAILITDQEGGLAGIFTDSDLARLLESRRDEAIDGPLAGVMTRSPQTVAGGAPMSRAIEILAERKISELPVVDPQRRPLGLIDITDVVGLLPRDASSSAPTESLAWQEKPARSPAAAASPTVPFRTKPSY